MTDEHLIIRALIRNCCHHPRVRIDNAAIVNCPLNAAIEVTQDVDGFWVELKNDKVIPKLRPVPQNYLESLAQIGVSAARIGAVVVVLAAVARLTELAVEYVWSIGGFCG